MNVKNEQKDTQRYKGEIIHPNIEENSDTSIEHPERFLNHAKIVNLHSEREMRDRNERESWKLKYKNKVIPK